ncbi:MAG: L-lactate dehydrogenase [Candidatus Helarchaeota archaeon]
MIEDFGTRIELKSKIAIIGMGTVGSTFAFSLMVHGLVSEIVLIDKNYKKAEGEAMDLNHGLPFVNPTQIWAGDYSDCKNADIIVLTAGVAQKPGESRLALVNRNTKIFKEIVAEVVNYNKSAILLIATNPVDIMTYLTLKLSKFSSTKVIGSGTILDTARLRYLLSTHFSIDPRNIHAYILGEHGDSEVPIWSLANIAGISLQDSYSSFKQNYGPIDLNSNFKEVKSAAYKIIERKGKTYYAIALGLTKIVKSIVKDENAILTVSSLIQNYHGVSNICISVPAIINRMGIREILMLPLNTHEVEMFKESAAILQAIIDSLDI